MLAEGKNMTSEFENNNNQLVPNTAERKSDQTRRRIIDATKRLISQGKYTYMTKITDIARAANIAQPHFYIYFSSVQDVVYAIAEESYSSNTGFRMPLGADWSGEKGFLLLREAVLVGFAKWKEYHAINVIGLLLADKEEGRFRELRTLRFKLLGEIFSEKVINAQRLGHLSPNINPELRGHQCVNIMMNMAQQYDSLVARGFSGEQIVDETTYLLLSAVGLNYNF